jgi:hypothetical protein
MKSWGYYIGIFVEEFNTQMTYQTGIKQGPISEKELRLVKDLRRCDSASDYLDAETLNEMKNAFVNGLGNLDLGEFARVAKLGAKVSNSDPETLKTERSVILHNFNI